MKLQILKTGLIFLALNLILVFTTNAQVGIGTTDPKSSLQVEGNPGDTTTPDGIQVPSLTITQLEGKIIGGAYGADQDGAIVYISNASIGSSISETADIKNKGFYFYFHNGVSGIWRVIGEQKIDLTNPDRVPRWDGTNLIEGSIIDSGGNIGIGTLTPDAQLDVEGSFQFKDGNEGTGRYLTSDSQGNVSWREIRSNELFRDISGPDFSCLGNTGTLFLTTSGSIIRDVDVQGDFTYAIDNLRLNIINTSDKTNLTLTGTIALSNFAVVTVDGDYAYVCGPDFRVINISNPASPNQLSLLAVESFVKPVINDNIAYVIDASTNELKVIDITSKLSPFVNPPSTLALGSGSPNSMTRVGDYLYILSYGSNDLKVIDISNPFSPSLASTIAIGDIMDDHTSSGNFVYIANGTDDEMQIFDVSDPLNPIARGAVTVGVFPYRISIRGNFVFVADASESKLFVIDVSDPDNPGIEQEFNSAAIDFPVGLEVQDNYAYMVDQNSKNLEIFELTCFGSADLLISVNGLSGEVMSTEISSIETDPKVSMTTSDVIPRWDGTSLVDGSIIDVDGNVSVSSSANTTLTVQSPDDSMSMIRAIGNSQGTGAIEVGQSETFGGGLSYNGDNNPQFIPGEFQDHITFYRLANGIRFPVFYYSALGDNVVFNGSISAISLSTGQGFTELYAMNQNVRTTDNVTFNTINTGQGANKLYDMNQNVLTSSNVTFNTINTSFINTGPGATEVYLMNQNVRTDNNVTFNTINTGQGANELYDMNQNVLTTSNVTFSTINTGQGANELYDMNQNVQTTDNVTFNRIRAGSGITSTEGTLHIKAQAGVFPSLLLEGGSEDISFPDGDALQFGHWNFSNNTFTERLRINSSGNVGIGTSSISERLVVNGNALKTSGGSSWLTTSDKRLKKNIKSYDLGLQEVLKIRPVSFNYNEISGQNTENQYVGIIAQELKEIAPDMVSTFMLNEKEYYNVDDSAMTYMLINAVKELKAENDELKKKLEKIEQLEAMLIELKADLNVSNNKNFENVVQK